ncbi:polyphosphate polymerase domain-containing protein [Planctomicrobium sp. SH661]|uniref:polyphosphate polymerase domain-containing protein n=1 Tax=Planctomicrobium sp. SH661 TaxID=3448124 RepID=UPI003F5C2E36
MSEERFDVSNDAEPTSSLSPSLTARAQGATAFEVKFLIDEAVALKVEAWAARQMEPDPHGHPAQSGSYQVTSLYTDTVGLDVYHRTPKYRRRKYRLRRYGNEPTIHLERKVRRGERVAKRRTSVPESDLHFLAQTLAITDWQGHWFHHSLLRKSLVPTGLLIYQRTAFVGSCPEGPLRLTLDRQIRGLLTSSWNLETGEQALPLLPGEVVLELKFREAMPLAFKQLVAELQLNTTGLSKYRRCLDACGAMSRLKEPEVKYA